MVEVTPNLSDYLLFAYHGYYPAGGANDLICKVPGEREARETLRRLSREGRSPSRSVEYAHLLNLSTLEIDTTWALDKATKNWVRM